MPDAPPPPKRHLRGAVAVGVGIFLSRIAGLVRERVFAHYMGRSEAAGAFRAALRIPNILQNLLGEGVLSASFIPVYSRLRAQGRDADAERVARAVGTLLLLAASIVSLLGVVAAPLMVDLIVPGYSGETRASTIRLVQILFPGVALLVMSAWCLGVLNSHRRFFLSYVSPVLWNAALVATAVVAARRLADPAGFDMAIWLAWGAVIGSALQFLVQFPSVIVLVRGVRPTLAVRDPDVRATLRAFGPVFVGRGSVQLSSYLDQWLASYLGAATVAAMAFVQTLYTLPVSLFGMAVSAAELPEMSGATGDDDAVAAHLQRRLRVALRRVVFLVVPSAVAFVMIGGVIVGLLFQSGNFAASDTASVWLILSGSAIGLSAGTQGRLLNSAFYALRDTRTPLYAALVRVGFTFGAGGAVVLLRHRFGYGPDGAAFGLTASAGIAAWIEFLLLDRWLGQRIGKVPIPTRLGLGALALASVAGAVAAGAAWIVRHQLHHGPVPQAAVALPIFAGIYLGGAALARVPEADAFVGRLLRRRRR
ncbi:MAG TPA: murein biosynthesis integral membrane protein MurJ [Kofleriaceae bacterium]|nr:murein biosynthesis integral membrane protein MurJ [Kofleriaceae bacterium]